MSDNEAFVTELLSAQIASLNTENAALRAAVERVLALHEIFGDWCDRCNCVAPCATIRALEVGRE